MSCCGGNFGHGCGGCKMYPDLWYSEVAGGAAETVVIGIACQMTCSELSGTVVAAAENGCKCGANCTCKPCNCK